MSLAVPTPLTSLHYHQKGTGGWEGGTKAQGWTPVGLAGVKNPPQASCLWPEFRALVMGTPSP